MAFGWLRWIFPEAVKFTNLIHPERTSLRRLVDAEYYYRVYPDIVEAKVDAAQHYLEAGWCEGRNPSEGFNTLWYLHIHHDAALSGVNPLLHYLRCPGKPRGAPDEFASPDWIRDAATNLTLPPIARAFAANYDLVSQSEMFHAEFYQARYPDVFGDQIEHYLRYGWRMGYDPGPDFSTNRYLDANPDVREAGSIPLIHFVKFGRREGRNPSPPPSSTEKKRDDGSATPANPRSSVSEAAEAYRSQYITQVEIAAGRRAPQYAPLSLHSVQVSADDPAILAFYLPQFHPIAENDRWWGRGFTEWTNVSKATAQFVGHYQPRLPGELGFYDLRLPEVMARQIGLAKHYGVSGFCFHYYWFDGHRLLDRPLELFLSQSAIEFDFPYCLCWANENWTRRWDGSEHDILIQQIHTHLDYERVFKDLSRFMGDKRYIRVDGMPVILVYRPSIIPDVTNMAEIWRKLALKAGLPGLYLVATNAFGFDYPEEIGFDAVCQFPPHAVHVRRVDETGLQFLNGDFSGKIYDYGEAVNANLKFLQRIGEEGRHRDYFAGVMPAWDNEARKPGNGQVFHNSTPQKFRCWLGGAVEWSKNNNPAGRRFVFVNAWNEWAEGAYLEPDRKFGYAYLSAVANVRAKGASNDPTLSCIADRLACSRKPKGRTVLCLHVFHEASTEACAAAIEIARSVMPCDVILSLPAFWDEGAAIKAVDLMDPVRIVIASHRGRDVGAFLKALHIAENLGYTLGCKLHSQKLEEPSGSQSIESMVGNRNAIESAMAEFAANASVGLVAPLTAMASWSDLSETENSQRAARAILARIGLEGAKLEDFVADSMFWFRLSAVTKATQLPFDISDFEPDLDAIDGTLAHSLDRLFPTLVVGSGYKVSNYATVSLPRARSWTKHLWG